MTYPELTIGMCIYYRPYYAVVALKSLLENLEYKGTIRYHIVGLETPENLRVIRKLVESYNVPVVFEEQNNLAAMSNAIAHNSGEVWMTTLDDYLLRYHMDITPDVELLLNHQDIGVIRLGLLSLWDTKSINSGEVVTQGRYHWWKLSKERSNDPYISGLFCHLYHRRYWDTYGDVPLCPPDHPGLAETEGSRRFREKSGCTIAIPMRYGEDTPEHPEPFWHFGLWHADDYAKFGKERIRGLGVI